MSPSAMVVASAMHWRKQGWLGDEAAAGVVDYFVVRGWTVVHQGPDLIVAAFPESLSGANLYGARISAAELGVTRLTCEVDTRLVATVEPTGVINGCAAHRRGPRADVPFGSGLLDILLDTTEQHARTIDPITLAHCVLLGACGGQSADQVIG